MTGRARQAHLWIVAVTALVTMLTAGCALLTGDDGAADSDNGSGSDVASTAVDFDPVFARGVCDESIPVELGAECGTVEVPMNWETGEGTVTLAVAVFARQSDSEDERPAGVDLSPVLYLVGGPGGHAIETLRFTADTVVEPFVSSRDVVVFDQRGAGLSQPRLSCDEITEVSRELEDIAVVSDDEADRRFHDALALCRQRLSSDGVDLSAFNTRFSARDVEAIRQALGYERVSLFGVSYGTKLGLEVLRRHPDNISAVVLDSVFPPEVDSVAENPQTFIDAYRKVTEACAAEAGCLADGDLGDRFVDLVARLQIDPVQVTVEDWVDGSTDQVFVNGDSLVAVVVQSLYSPGSFSDLPELADDLERGRVDVLEEYLSQQRTAERFFTSGVFYAITCREEVSFADPATVVDPPDPFAIRGEFDLAANVGSNAFGTCQAFDNGSAPASANEPVMSDVPALLLAGAFDPVTPVQWAEDAAEDLTSARLLVAPNDSHGVSNSSCGISIVADFLAEPEADLDTGCLAERDWGFVDAPPAEIELVEATFTSQDLSVTTVRPESWSTGALGGDQYRRRSILDPTQLHQLAGDDQLGQGLEQFIEGSVDVDLGPAEPFSDSSTLGPLQGSDLAQEWSRRSAVGSGVVVEWFERPVGDGTVYVILVAEPTELESLVDQVFEPALSSITIDR